MPLPNFKAWSASVSFCIHHVSHGDGESGLQVSRLVTYRVLAESERHVLRVTTHLDEHGAVLAERGGDGDIEGGHVIALRKAETMVLTSRN